MIFRVSALLLLLLAGSASASGNLLPPELETFRNQGVDALFNMDYDGARSAFQKMIDLVSLPINMVTYAAGSQA